MAEQPMHHRPERYEDTEDPDYPPQSTGPAPAIVAGLWYVLAPVAIILLVLFVVLLYWFGRGPEERDAVEPTTGVQQQQHAKPGGFEPDPRHDSPEDEIEFRGGR
jgi:hypothetical protein